MAEEKRPQIKSVCTKCGKRISVKIIDTVMWKLHFRSKETLLCGDCYTAKIKEDFAAIKKK